MANMKPKKATDQRQKFIEAARKAEADESETAFEAKLKKIAKAKPKESAPKGR
ncbi:MAG: hypothetical protein KGI46_05170 [Alphaproteobacteria bacterium]|nr:hypothetical protein [Alphaproteobacteria bacterium]